MNKLSNPDPQTTASSTQYKKDIPILGMHCASCEIMIGDKLKEIDGVASVKVQLRTSSATIVSNRPIDDKELESAVNSAGYKVGNSPNEKPLISRDRTIWKDLVIGLGVVAGIYTLYQLLGLGSITVTSSNLGNNGLPALVVGLTAGFSTCMALIGGLVLGIASSHAEKNPSLSAWSKFQPHIVFNLGRIIAFIIFGAIIGLVGSAFALKGSLLGLLTILAGLVMLVLGLKLTEVFPRISQSLTLPSSIANKLSLHQQNNREYSHKSALIAGATSFFLPCGFTQAMQLLAVSTGDPWQASIIMGAFAIGTTPGLLSLGGVSSVIKGAKAKSFFRVIGVAVVAMAIINLVSGLNLIGFNQFSPTTNQTTSSGQKSADGTNVLKTTYTLQEDIIPNNFTAKVNQPTTLEVDVKEDGEGCMSTIMIIGLDDTPQYLKSGKVIKLSFTPQKPGKYLIACAMGVPRGTVIVTE